MHSTSKKGIKISAVILDGFPDANILGYASENSIDLIVMGNRKQIKGIKKIFAVGSTSRKVIEKAQCPVMLVNVDD